MRHRPADRPRRTFSASGSARLTTRARLRCDSSSLNGARSILAVSPASVSNNNGKLPPPSRMRARWRCCPIPGPPPVAELCLLTSGQTTGNRRDSNNDGSCLSWADRARREPLNARRGTARPFTVVVCNACAAEQQLSVIDELRPTIRCCPHAMLVSAPCILGPVTCAARPAGCGVMAIFQPCTTDWLPFGPPQWVGPITNNAEAALLKDWLELGRWENAPLPKQLSKHVRWAGRASRSI